MITIQKGYEGEDGYYICDENGDILFAEHVWRDKHNVEQRVIDVHLSEELRQILTQILSTKETQKWG